MTAMMFYQELVPLNDRQHAQLRLSPLANYRFAARANSVPALSAEALDCAREFPIVFAGPSGAVVPAVLLGLREGENLYVDATGRWRARYVPSFIRRYPFALGTDSAGQSIVCIDAKAPCWGSPSGEALFENGQAAPTLQRTMAFLREFQAVAQTTAQCGERVEALGLLRDADSLAQLKNGRQFRLTGLRVIDEAKLAALDDATLLALARDGTLKLIHAHLVSLGHLGRLIDWLSERVAAEERKPVKSRFAATT